MTFRDARHPFLVFASGKLTPRLRLWFLLVGCFVIVQTFDRLALLIWSGATKAGVGAGLASVVAYGLLEDAAIGLSMGLPFLVGLVLFRRWLGGKVLAVASHLLLLAMSVVLVFNEGAQILFWNEFDSRFNSIAVNYLMFPREVVGNIRESFPLGTLLPIVLVAGAALYLLTRRALVRALAAPPIRGERRTTLAVATVSVAFAAVVFATDFPSRYANRELAEIATNGLHSLVRAAVTNDEKYDGLYLTLSDDEALALVRGMTRIDASVVPLAPGKAAEPALWRRVENPGPAQKLNVVLVIEESFGSTYVDGLDNSRNESISPRLSALARDGVFFTNVYATGNRTVRGLEAILTSFPPIPGVSTARRSGSEGMNSLPFLLRQQGYRTGFLYGGLATFDNMGNYWSAIGFEKVWDQRDIADTGFTTIWGAADEYIFTEAIKRMDANATKGSPFFLGVLTVTNHRPYVYPDGRIDKPAKRKRKENSATYADWAFGDFIERASTHPWFKDTVFIFVGDHGPRVYGAATVPVPSYRVPLLFYAPAHLRAKRIETAGSSVDVAPTLLGLLGFTYDSPFFGVDLTRIPPDKGRVVIEHNYAIAMGTDGRVAAILPGKRTEGYDMKIGPHDLVPTPSADPELARRTAALTQTAHRLFYGGRYHDLRAKTGP